MRSTIKPITSLDFGNGRCLDCALYSPRELGSAKTASQQFFIYTTYSRQVGERNQLPFVRKNLVRDSIVGLLHARSPSAIAGFVVAIVVDSLKCVFLSRTFSHVVQEINEFTPTSTNRNSAFLVVLESWGGFLRASGDHASPRTVGRGVSTEPRVAMNNAFGHISPFRKAKL